MLLLYQLFVVMALLLGPGVVGNCVNCNDQWKFHCEVNVTGYHCEKGAEIIEQYVPKEDLLTSTVGEDVGPHDHCTPYPFHAIFIKTYCCFYSPELGCQLALNPAMQKFENKPVKRCMECSKYCRCANNGATPVQSLPVFCLLVSLALSQICSSSFSKLPLQTTE